MGQALEKQFHMFCVHHWKIGDRDRHRPMRQSSRLQRTLSITDQRFFAVPFRLKASAGFRQLKLLDLPAAQGQLLGTTNGGSPENKIL